MTRARVLATALVVSLGAGAGAVAAAPQPIAQPPAATTALKLEALPPRVRTTRDTVGENEVAGKVLRRMNAPTDELLAGAGRSLNAVRPGDVFELDWRSGEDRPFRMRLLHDAHEAQELHWDGKRYVLRSMPVPYAVTELAGALTVTSSLWAVASKAGFSPGQIMDLAKIFEYDVDFNTELLANAKFRLVLDRLVADDGAVRIGDVRAAILDNGGKQYVAIRHRHPDGTLEWYDKDGKARRKAFLRSPLEFSRVTSGFSTGRYHPILHRMRAHKGTDFGAPSGTPIRAVADGVVARAGWAGGHGNKVELKHEGGVSTGYSHLSSIAVKAGTRVRQGEVIGRVGSTGMSTGPHLHYEYMVNGVHKDPMKQAMSVAVPLPAAELPAFIEVRDQLVPSLESAVELSSLASQESSEKFEGAL